MRLCNEWRRDVRTGDADATEVLPGARRQQERPGAAVRGQSIDGVRNVVVYANIGHSVFSDDGGHFYAGGGFKVVIGR